MARPRGLRLHTPTFDFVVGVRSTSRTEVAVAARRNLSFVSDLAHGRYGASPATAQAIAEFLRVDPEVLFPELGGFIAPDRSVAAVA